MKAPDNVIPIRRQDAQIIPFPKRNNGSMEPNSEALLLQYPKPAKASRIATAFEYWRCRKTSPEFIRRRKIASLSALTAVTLASLAINHNPSELTEDREATAACVSELDKTAPDLSRANNISVNFDGDSLAGKAWESAAIAEACLTSDNDIPAAKQELQERGF